MLPISLPKRADRISIQIITVGTMIFYIQEEYIINFSSVNSNIYMDST